MSPATPVTSTVDADGLGWITFDDPASRANVFNPALQTALGAALDHLATQPVRAVILLSAKERIFVAGADLKWLGRLPDAATAEAAARGGQALFARLADLRVPVVAAIHGACAGGGYELALAATWRVASDAKETQLGLPEIGLGLIPGWGGCARLPRLIGAPAALAHILKAQLVPAPAALAASLVDEVVPAASLRDAARAAALRLAAGPAPARPTPPAADAAFFAEQRRAAATRFRHQPAPLAAIDAVEQGQGGTLEAALAAEAAAFGRVAATDVAHHLVHVFFLKDAARKTSADAWFPPAAADTPAPKPIRYVGVVGAGVMGSGIAHWCAARGLGVILKDVDAESVKRGVDTIRGLFADMVKRGQLDAATAHRATGGIGITTDLIDFEDCDLVIEAIVEDVAAKRDLFTKLAGIVRPDCLLASNTSALPIEELMAGVPHPERTLGLHFFNPVARMPLVELVLGAATDRTTAVRALDFVGRLGKTPVVCRSAPGFLVTRVLFFYLNAACRLRETGVSAAAIDDAMRAWGWPMGPLRLIDEVGVDVTDFIFGEMAHYFPDRFTPSGLCRRLLDAGLRGRKNGASSGFYTYADTGEALNPAAASLAPAATVDLAPAAIQDQLLGLMVAEAERVLAEGVLRSADDVDLALLLGAGFPAWRGGLLRWARAQPHA